MDTAIWRLSDDNICLGRTGIALLADNREALAARVLAARSAERSLDLMYYLWHDDGTSRVLMNEIVRAADRGVRVRMLLDDINAGHRAPAFAALDRHPNIELRLFNPARMRNVGILRTVELVIRRAAMTRRMHNKAWIADDGVAIVGGRNIGDAYFDAADTNFRDLDLLLVGPAARDTRNVFEAFWNFRAAKPIATLVRRSVATTAAAFDRELPGDQGMLDKSLGGCRSIHELVAKRVPLTWTERARVIADPPHKIRGTNKRNWLMRELLPVIRQARRQLEISSPYFIPGREGTAILADLVRRGAEVVVLTNSLAATDVAAVHGAYANYRQKLLRSGVKLFELQPYRRRRNISVMGSKGASLHTKAFAADGLYGFVGSLNFDPRSVSLNTEMGVIFEDEVLVSELRAVFRSERAPGSSYRVALADDRLVWLEERNGKIREHSREPHAGLARRLLSSLIGRLPLEAEL